MEYNFEDLRIKMVKALKKRFNDEYADHFDIDYLNTYFGFFNYITHKRNNKTNIGTKLISTTERDFNIYVNKIYDGYTYKEISEHYNITPTRVVQIIKYIDRRFKEFCNVKLDTVFSLRLDTRTRNVLELQLKFNKDTPIEELYKHDAKYYLHLRNFGQSSLDKLNNSLIKSGHPKIE